MAAERLTQEVKIGDLPRIELGAFNWQPVDRIITPTTTTSAGSTTPGQIPLRLPPNFLPANALTSREFPLNLLENKTFAGTGYNVVWRPRSQFPLQKDSTKVDKPQMKDQPEGKARDVLELNLTAETLAFSGNIGDVPNRGADAQEDLILRGLPYVQRVGAFEDEETGSNNSKSPVGIHFEPGVFMFVPECKKNPAGQPATINRMASIPHGTTINAQGGIQPAQVSGKPAVQTPGKPDFAGDIQSIIPFKLGKADPVGDRVHFFDQLQLNFDVNKEDRLPEKFTNFSSTRNPATMMYNLYLMLMTP